jgi:hypothetical protein
MPFKEWVVSEEALQNPTMVCVPCSSRPFERGHALQCYTVLLFSEHHPSAHRP